MYPGKEAVGRGHTGQDPTWGPVICPQWYLHLELSGLQSWVQPAGQPVLQPRGGLVLTSGPQGSRAHPQETWVGAWQHQIQVHVQMSPGERSSLTELSNQT